MGGEIDTQKTGVWAQSFPRPKNQTLKKMVGHDSLIYPREFIEAVCDRSICIADMKYGQVIYHLRLKQTDDPKWSTILEIFESTTAGKFGAVVSYWERISQLNNCLGAIVTRNPKTTHGATFYIHKGLDDQIDEVERLRRHGLMTDNPYIWNHDADDWIPGPPAKFAIDGPGELQEIFQSSRPFYLKHQPVLNVYQNVYGALY
jgi:hypothetical protein